MAHDALAPISAVVSTRDRPAQLSRCLDALLGGATLPAEVLVVDEGDPRPVRAALAARGALPVPVRHLVQAQRGVSAGRNAGAVRARQAVVAFLGDVDLPGPRWVEGVARTHRDATGPLLATGPVVAQLLPDGAWPVLGSAFSVTRSAYLDAGGCAEHPGLTGCPDPGDGVLLVRRLRQAAVEVRVVPELAVPGEAPPGERTCADRWTGLRLGTAVAEDVRRGERTARQAARAWLRARCRAALQQPTAIGRELAAVRALVRGAAVGTPRAPSARRERAVRTAGGVLRAAARPRPALSAAVTRGSRHVRGPVDGLALSRLAGPSGRRALAIGDPEPLLRARARQGSYAAVDVAGTDPHDLRVTVVSEARTPGSLPAERWDVVVLTAPADPGPEAVAAALTACRRGGLLVVRGPARAHLRGLVAQREASLVRPGAAALAGWLPARKA